MTERPILFSAEMVRAILAQRKTQTRRVMKVQPPADAVVTVERYFPIVSNRRGEDWYGPEIFGAHWDDDEKGLRYPYGAPGDLLWVRETVAHGSGLKYHVAYKADSQCGAWGWDGDGKPLFSSHGYVLEGDAGRAVGNYGMHRYGKRWTPSIHMPRWASRITLRITDVRVERLQDISRQDCEAEGCAGGHGSIPGYNYSATPREHFFHLWNRINGPGAWEANPWVWVLSFERLKP